MFEAQHRSMQRLAREGGDGLGGFLCVRPFGFEGALLAVKLIADQRCAEVGEMCADLMRAAGVQTTFEQRRSGMAD